MDNYIILTSGPIVSYRIKLKDILSYCNHRIKGSLVKVRWCKEPLEVDQHIDEISLKILKA